MDINFRELNIEEIDVKLFRNFIRRQVVKECFRKSGNKWIIKDDPFIDDWSDQDYIFLIECLKNTINTGGVVFGAFSDDILKGFASVESKIFGKKYKYLDLTSIHVSEDMRGRGIGKKLFNMSVCWAKIHGGEKLYISSHSAVETQYFYKKMGCVEALEYNKEHVEKEPFDCQLEFVL